MSIEDGTGGITSPPTAGTGQPGGGWSPPSGKSGKHVYPKRAIWRELLKMAWERGEYRWTGRLSDLLAWEIRDAWSHYFDDYRERQGGRIVDG